MEDDFSTGPLACCSVLRVNAPVQPRRPSTLTLVLIRRWTHLIPPLTPHSPFVPATSCPDPNIDPQVDQAYFAPHPPPVSPHGFNYDISKTSLLYRLSLICFWHLRTLSKNRTNERQRPLSPSVPVEAGCLFTVAAGVHVFIQGRAYTVSWLVWSFGNALCLYVNGLP